MLSFVLLLLSTITPASASIDAKQWVSREPDFYGQPGDNISFQEVALAKNGSVVAISGGVDPSNRFWGLAVYEYSHNKSKEWMIRGHVLYCNNPGKNGGFRHISMSSDASRIAARNLYSDVHVYQWNQYSKQYGLMEKIHSNGSPKPLLSKTGNVLVIASWDSEIIFHRWDGTHWKTITAILNFTNTAWLNGDLAMDYSATTIAISDANFDCDNTFAMCGRVRVYEWNSIHHDWQQKGQDLVGEEQYARFGSVLDLSMDGSVLSVGCENGLYVQVYDFRHGIWRARPALTNGNAYGAGHIAQLSADGRHIAVGRDPVVFYEWDGGRWHRHGQALPYMAVKFDEAASFSDDGTSFALQFGVQGSFTSKDSRVRVFDFYDPLVDNGKKEAA